MKNYNQQGNVMTFTAPGGGVVSGGAYQIGQLLVVAVATVAAGEQFAGNATGVVQIPKNGAQAFAEGALVYWDGAQGSSTSAGNLLVGCAAEAALAPAAELSVRLNGTAQADS